MEMSQTSGLRCLSAAAIEDLKAQVATRSQQLLEELPWLDSLDIQAGSRVEPAPRDLKIVAFNAERGSRFDGIRSLLQSDARLRDADVILLSEVDWGMARSENRHVARDLAEELGMGYVFGVEFLELTKGEALELEAPGENTWSFHGNAILSKYVLRNPRLLRLPRFCSWAEGSQARIGGRMALLAELATEAGEITVASTHLEVRTPPAGRRAQFRPLIDALADRPVCFVGGDLNTATIDTGEMDQVFALPDYLAADPLRLRRPEGYEPIFLDVRAAGFLVEELNVADETTNIPLGIPDPRIWTKLDWLFGRGICVLDHHMPPAVVRAEHEGTRVSDHDFVVAQFRVGV